MEKPRSRSTGLLRFHGGNQRRGMSATTCYITNCDFDGFLVSASTEVSSARLFQLLFVLVFGEYRLHAL